MTKRASSSGPSLSGSASTSPVCVASCTSRYRNRSSSSTRSQAGRGATAERQQEPGIVVMHDSTLAAVCEMQPRSLADLRRVPGIGERKLELYGDALLAALQRFAAGDRVAPPKLEVTPPQQETLALLRAGCALDEIARQRGRQRSTIVDTVAHLVERGECEFNPAWVRAGLAEQVAAACA